MTPDEPARAPMDRVEVVSRWAAVGMFPLIGLHIAARLWSPDAMDIIEATLVFVLMVGFALEEVVRIVAPDTPLWRIR